MKEFVYLFKELGFSYSLFYFFYKIKLRVKLSRYFKEKDYRQQNKIEQIYAALYLFSSESCVIKNRKYILPALPGEYKTGIKLRPYSSDAKVFQQIFIQEEYKSVVDIYDQIFGNAPKFLIDCGGNIGLASIYFKIKYPDLSLTLIEPFKENVEMIKLNFEGFGIQNFNLFEGGVWNKDVNLGINRDFRDGREWSISLNEAKGGENQITGFSLLRLMKELGEVTDILKLDVEGAEKELFSEYDYAADILKRVKCIAIEIHDEFHIRDLIYENLRLNNYFFFNTNELTIGINRSFIKNQ